MLRHARSGLFKKLDAEAIQEFSSHGIEMYENAMRSSGELVVKATFHPQTRLGMAKAMIAHAMAELDEIDKRMAKAIAAYAKRECDDKR
jgi:hypothetical protein